MKYIFLGIVQGLTEFLPVSSSGHIAILSRVFGIQDQAVAAAVILHLATALALIVFFAKDIIQALRDARIIFFVVIVTVITGIIGILGKNFFEGLFSSPKAIACAWLVTGMVLIFADSARQQNRGFNSADFLDGIALGFAQALAIIPGISRSGATVTTMLFRNFEPESAFRLSNLVAIPAICGAALFELKGVKDTGIDCKAVIPGFVVAFLVGLLALWILRRVIELKKLRYFGYYCIMVAVITFIFIK